MHGGWTKVEYCIVRLRMIYCTRDWVSVGTCTPKEDLRYKVTATFFQSRQIIIIANLAIAALTPDSPVPCLYSVSGRHFPSKPASSAANLWVLEKLPALLFSSPTRPIILSLESNASSRNSNSMGPSAIVIIQEAFSKLRIGRVEFPTKKRISSCWTVHATLLGVLDVATLPTPEHPVDTAP